MFSAIGLNLINDLVILMNYLIRQYLRSFRRYYPGILEWYSGLTQEFSTGRRSLLVSWKGPEIQGLAITKNGERAKLCHISVSPSARDRGLGLTLMQSAIQEMVCSGAREIRVTTGEEIFCEHSSFFFGVGFRPIDWQVHRYRRGSSEILWKLDIRKDLFGSHDNSIFAFQPGISTKYGPPSMFRSRPARLFTLPVAAAGYDSILVPQEQGLWNQDPWVVWWSTRCRQPKANPIVMSSAGLVSSSMFW
ncbi:MAG: GNAT family N-acetyltransferase [Acidobacteria bacterium]|nr:GNAT family N-acetyltransferase [Acidobacteriota bacterium]